MICAWIDTSSAETASSQTMNSGLSASARAMPTRCRFAVPRCAEAPPPLLPAGAPGQLSACYRANELSTVAGEAA